MKTQPASEYALLGALMTQPRHGYEIWSFLEKGLGPTWHIPTSQLYAQLKRLEERGHLYSSLEAQDNRPSRRVFEITDKGREAFLSWVLSPARHVRDLRVEFLAKLFFIRKLELDGSRLIQEQSRVLDETLSRLETLLEQEKDSHRRLTAGFKRATAEAWQRWLQQEARPFVKEIKQT
ncbi:MAG: PadR family transcriptional regulator [Thermodesulfobacteriota bacterium]